MSRRGHLYGMISTYHHSWFLKSDGKGTLWVSDAVGAHAQGDTEDVSVTEVCPLPSEPHIGRASPVEACAACNPYCA